MRSTTRTPGWRLALAGILAALCTAVAVAPATARPDGARTHASGKAQTRAYACRQDIHPQDPAYPGVHVATLAQAPNGDLLYGFYAGREEQAEDVATYMSRLPKGENTWQPPRVIFDEAGRPDGNAVLYSDGQRVHLFFSTIMQSEWTEAILRRIHSDDNGRTWSAPESIREEWGWLFGNRPFKMSNGELIVPIYAETNWSSGFYIPSADLNAWPSYPENFGEWLRSPNGAIQPTTVELEDGHLLAFMRTRDREIYRSESFDYGRTWSPAVPTGLPNNNARVSLLKLDDGALLLAYNPTTRGREMLRLALSYDNGRTWPHSVGIESEAGQEFSYPELLATRDGMLHLGYTHRRKSMRHLVFNEEFVRSGADIPSNPTYGATEYRNGRLRDVAHCGYEVG